MQGGGGSVRWSCVACRLCYAVRASASQVLTDDGSPSRPASQVDLVVGPVASFDTVKPLKDLAAEVLTLKSSLVHIYCVLRLPYTVRTVSFGVQRRRVPFHHLAGGWFA
jgi:hypothetical protein